MKKREELDHLLELVAKIIGRRIAITYSDEGEIFIEGYKPGNVRLYRIFTIESDSVRAISGYFPYREIKNMLEFYIQMERYRK